MNGNTYKSKVMDGNDVTDAKLTCFKIEKDGRYIDKTIIFFKRVKVIKY